MPAKPYNPLDKDSIAENIVRELVALPCRPLPSLNPRGQAGQADVFEGAGIYAIYYSGDFPAYAEIASANADGKCERPIYIGKADPKGGRKGTLGLDSSLGFALYNRLREHASSIEQAANLRPADFRCRSLVVDEVWIGLGERIAIQKYLPLWNTLIDGFGNHDPGGRRKSQYRSDWDVVHPGRVWAEKSGSSPKTADQILRNVVVPPPESQLEELASAKLATDEE